MDDLFNRKADNLFRKYGVQGVPTPSTDAGKVTGDDFTKDFLKEIQNASLELAKTRQAETVQRIAELQVLIESARAGDDLVMVKALQNEKKTLEAMLPDNLS
jgi:hypothetical protein